MSRVEATSEVSNFYIELDVNTDIYPMENGAYYAMALASSLTPDGSEEFDIFQYQNEGAQGGMGSLLDQYQYVMHGKIFKYVIKQDKM